jgi:NhaA family Na+:H+ antiporter
MFGLANTGVQLTSISEATWIVLGALVIGKTGGIFLMGLIARLLGYPLPAKVGLKELALIGLIAGIGLTVAIFVAGEAFTDPVTQGAAKMGALLSGGCALLAIMAGRLLKIRRID